MRSDGNEFDYNSESSENTNDAGRFVESLKGGGGEVIFGRCFVVDYKKC